jgi:glycosyltransferase involved in cell wall biosynthesis
MNKDMPEVSVIMAALNEQDNIVEAAESVRSEERRVGKECTG